MFLAEILDARQLIVFDIVPTSVPGSLFVEEPGVTGPQETVQKPKQNGGVGFSKTPHRVCLALADGYIDVIVIFCLLTGVTLAVDPRVPVRDGLQIKKPIRPGRGCCEPDEGNEGRQEEVDLWVVLLLISVEAGVEEVESQAVRIPEYDIAVGMSVTIIITWR